MLTTDFLRYGAQVEIGVNNIVRHANLAVRGTYHQAVLDQHAHIFMHSFHIAIQLARQPAQGGRPALSFASAQSVPIASR